MAAQKLSGTYILMDEEWNGRPAYQREDVPKGKLGACIFSYYDTKQNIRNWFLVTYSVQTSRRMFFIVK